MRKSLLILAGLIAFGGISAQAQGPKSKLDKERKEKKEWKANLPQNPLLVKQSAAKDGPLMPDNILSVTPAMPLQFTFDKCDDVKSRPLVIKNPSDETIDAFLMFQNEADIELGDTVFEEYDNWENRYILNYFEINGFGYAASGNDPYLVKTNLATGGQMEKYCEEGYVGLAYDGKLFWTASGSYLIALDANLNPTGKQIYLGYNASVAFDGTNLITLESDNRPARVKAFDTNGNLVADYGTFIAGGYGLTYDPNTGLFWVAIEGSAAFRLVDGKANLEAVLYYDCAVVGFDTDGLPFMMDYDNSGILRKATKFSTYPKGISLSQSAISLKPGETVTVNVTASIEHGPLSETLMCMNLGNMYSSMPYFVRPVEFAYNIEPEFVATASAQFSAFAGYNVQPQTVWIKNTGCAPIIFDEEPTLDGGVNFSIGNLITPQNFEGALLAGDSIGAVISFYSDAAGNYTDKLIITTENTEPIEISLSATVAELDYTIPDDVVTATINCGANTATASCNIANNSGVTMSIGKSTATVDFTLHTGNWSSEVYWSLLNSAGGVVYSVTSSTYQSNYTDYNLTLELPNDTYTLDMNDSYGDGWNGGHITVKWDGKTLVNQATVNSRHNTATFAIEGLVAPVVIANGATVSQLTLPLDVLEIGDITELPVYFEGIADPVASIAVETAEGQGELAVGDAIDCGESIVNNSTFKVFAIAANNGCGTLNLSSVSIDNESNFIFENGGSFVKSISNIEIAPKDTLKLLVVFTPSETGARTGTITITPAEGTPATIQLTGTGINEPDYPVLAYGGEDLGFVKDTFGCSQTSATLKGRIANVGEADLVVTDPITITYQAGKVNNGEFVILDSDGNNCLNTWPDYNDYNYSMYVMLAEGDYKLMVYNYMACDGKIIIKSGSKTLLTANVADADANCDPYFNFSVTAADLAKHTVEPGDTLDLEINICPKNYSTGERTLSYPILTNDTDHDFVGLGATFRVANEPKLTFNYDVIDFGEVSIDQWAGKWITWENTGCGNYNDVSLAILLDNGEPNTNSPFEIAYESDGNVWFGPTTAGTFEDKLSVIIKYYYDGTKLVQDTLNVTLKGVGVASPSIVFPEELTVVTAEKGATTVTATVPVGNSSTATALKLTDANMAVITLNSGTGSSYSSSYWNLYRMTDHGEEYVTGRSSGYFTESGQQKTEEVSMPAGNYHLYMYSNGSNWNNGFVSIKTFDGIELLGETRNTSYNSSYNAYFSVAERNTDVTVAPATATANGTANVVFEIPVKGLASGEYYFDRVYNTNDASNPEIELVVKVVIEDDFDYEYSKEEVEFSPVHTGVTAYSSVVLRNLGTVGIDNYVDIKDGDKFDFNYDGFVAVGDSLKISLNFYSEEAGTFRDTLYINLYNPIEDDVVIDTIPIVAVANNTQVISVSTPNSRYAVAGDIIDVNVTFDAPVIVVEDEALASMPKLLMNTNSFALLDSIALDNSRDDLYTFTFHYPVVKADNVALFDYKEDSVYLNGHIVADISNFVLDEVKLPAVGTLASTFPVTIDNKAPQLVDTVFDLNVTNMTLSFSFKFSEQITGLDESCISLTGATLESLTTNDNITFSAVVTLENCVDIVVDITANLKDLAGNVLKIDETKKIPAIHKYTATVVAPTCTAEGYTQLVCSLCNHQEKTNVVAATGHKPGAAVKENETADGYDEVVYCTVCHAELSREHKTTTAIAENAASALIYGNNGAIIVEFAEADGREISVFDISGRAVAKAQANSTRTVIAMPEAGMYVVRVGQQSEKVVLQ